jgi:hypothetical protein
LAGLCRLKGKQPPEGWELIEEVIEDFEHQMKDAVNEDTAGKRRNETTWKVCSQLCSVLVTPMLACATFGVTDE